MQLMKHTLAAATVAVLLAGCAGQPKTYTLDTIEGSETVTMPKGTMTGAASVDNANALAKEIADSNNALMAQFNRQGGQISTLQRQMSDLQSTENKELAASEAALEKLERLAAQQGTGSITLFFDTGSSRLDQFQYERLVSFLDYLARESRARQVILVSIGGASAVGTATVNHRLSVQRSEAPLPVVDKYLVDIPHQFYKVTALGDMYAPKNAPMEIGKRYQSVRIIAAYDTAQLAGTPGS
jgi:outer membrane protein OmpA-like peptidoglycan-associated protein